MSKNKTRTEPEQNPNRTRTESSGYPLKGYLTKSSGFLPHPPLESGCTLKQQEVLHLLYKDYSLTKIARELKIQKSSVKERLDGLKNKGLATNEFHKWKVTEQGSKYLFVALDNRMVGCSGPAGLKSQHANEFKVKIKELPESWHLGNEYLQCLKANNFFHNKSTGQWFIYYEDCTIRISPGTRSISFWIIEQLGNSVEELNNETFDRFVQYFQMLEAKGFKLDNVLTSSNSEFANPNGFFAKLAQFKTKQGFRIETKIGKSFWVDYSERFDIAEEETEDYDTAKRMEHLAESAINSHADFNDLDKLIEITKNLVKIEAMHLPWHIRDRNQEEKNQSPIERADYII